jgi:small conductance mechanosensitive channel
MPDLLTVQLFFKETLPKFVLAVVIVLVGLYLGQLLRRVVTKVLKRTGAEAGVTHLLGQMVYWSVAILGFIIAVGLFVDLTALLAGLGLVGFALTFALQDVLKNFVAGILLLVQRPFIVGDYVRLESFEGTVRAINSRSTEMLTDDGLTVLLPNAKVLDNPITNFTRTPDRRIEILFTLPDDSDLPRVRELTLKALESVPHYLASPAPDLLFENASGGLTLKARVWVDTSKVASASIAKGSALSAVYDALKAEGIEFRYPRQEVAVYNKTEG